MSKISTSLVAALSSEIAYDPRTLEDATIASLDAGATALLVPPGAGSSVARIPRVADGATTVYHIVASVEDLRDSRALGSRAFRLASAAAANPAMLDLLHDTEEVLVPVANLATGTISDLVSRYRRPGLVLLCDAPWRVERELVSLAFFKWLQSLDCPVGFVVGDHPVALASAAALMGAASIEASVGGSALSPLLLRRLFASVRQAEALASGSAEHRMPEDVDALDDLRQSLVAARPIPLGTLICEDMLGVATPLTGLDPECISDVVGRRALYDIAEGDFITFGVISA